MFLFILLLFVSSCTPQSIPPFCTICNCNNKDASTNTFQVTCLSDITSQLFNLSFWQDSSNKTYPYQTLKVQNSPMLTLKNQFPVSNITYLDLANNSMVNISDRVFSNLQDMITLVLSYNNIEVIHPDAFDGQYLEGEWRPLKSLKNLHLDHNRIHSLDGDVFEHTPQVEVLTITHNPIKTIDQQTQIAITSLVYLKKLDLSYTQLSTLPDNFLHTPLYLSLLDLSGNNFDSIPKTLGDTHNLTILYFNNNAFVNLTSDNGFPKMPLLSLHFNNHKQLKSIGDGALSNLEHLEELYCFQNPELSHFDKHALSLRHDQPGDVEARTWPPLKMLYLQDNKLTNIDMSILSRWQDLKELDLTSNPWTCECENQWMVDELMPQYLQLDEDKAKAMKCAAPIEMAKYTFYDVYKKESTMRCLDAYGNRPERDGVLLVGILAGVLITIPLVLFIIYAYQRHWFGIFDNSPAAFSRQFYKRTASFEDGNF